MRLAVAVAVLLAAPMVLVRPARAGCPNVCDLTISGAATVDPPIACLTVAPSAETCDCGVFLVLTNHCPDEVAATDFQFTSCGAQGASPTGYQCLSIQPSNEGVYVLPVAASSGTGTKFWVLHVQEAGVTSAVTVQANVTSFGAGGCACALLPSDQRPGDSSAFLLGGGLAAVALCLRPRPGSGGSGNRHA